MKKKYSVVGFFLAVVVVAALLLGTLFIAQLFLHKSPQSDYPLKDDEYIGIANETIESKFFLARYPNSMILVDRSERLAVDYRDTYVRLRVFIDADKNKPSEMFLDMHGTIISEDISEYLQNGVEFQTILRGYYSGHESSAYYVIADEEQWLDVWSQHDSINQSQSPPPELDFSDEVVIAVFLGEFLDGNAYEVEIKGVHETDQSILVDVEKTVIIMTACRKCVIPSQPYHIIKLNKVDKEVEFNIVENTTTDF